MVYVEYNKVVKKEKPNQVEKRKITKKNALQEKKRENIWIYIQFYFNKF